MTNEELKEITRLTGVLADRDAEIERVYERYYDLIYQVASIYPGESRHDTAKRYIRERESRSIIGACKAEVSP